MCLGSHTHKQTRQTAASRGITPFINFTWLWKPKQTPMRSKLYKRKTQTNSRPLETNIVKMRNGVTPRLSLAQANAPNSTKPRHNAVSQFHMALERKTNTNTKQTLQTQDTNKLKTLRSEHCEIEKRRCVSALTHTTPHGEIDKRCYAKALTRTPAANITFLPLCFLRICGKKSTVIENVRRVVYFSLSSQTISSIQFQI